jgi:hypothetical protein
MNYVRNFFGFWRRFIVGDDSRIAVTILWSLILAKSLLINTVNAWLLIPVAVIVLLYVLIYEKIVDRTFFHNLSTLNGMLISCAIPFIFTTALPLLLFRINNGTSDLRYTWLPMGFYIITATVLLAVLYRLYKILPVLTIFLFGGVAVLFITVWQDAINKQLQDFFTVYPLVVSTVSVVVTIGFTASCIYSFTVLKKRKTGSGER